MNQVPESQMIQDIIDRTKRKPNSLSRNKMVSHLEDAKAHARLMETEAWPPTRPSAGLQPMTGDAPRTPVSARSMDPKDCTCPEGRINPTCPVHGL